MRMHAWGNGWREGAFEGYSSLRTEKNNMFLCLFIVRTIKKKSHLHEAMKVQAFVKKSLRSPLVGMWVDKKQICQAEKMTPINLDISKMAAKLKK